MYDFDFTPKTTTKTVMVYSSMLFGISCSKFSAKLPECLLTGGGGGGGGGGREMA